MASKIYRVYNDAGFTRDVNPFGDLKIKGSLEDGEFFHNKQLDSIVLKKQDYIAMIAFEDTFGDFFIDVICGNNVLFKGKFNMLVAEICKDKCTITITIKEDSVYECLKTNDEEHNIIATPELSKVSTSFSDVSGSFLVIGHDQWLLLTPAEQAEYGFLANAGVLLFPVAWAKSLFTLPCINGTAVPVGGTLENDDCANSGFFTYSIPYTGTVYSEGCGVPVSIGVTDPCNDDRVNVGTTTFEIVIGNPVTLNVWVDRDFGVSSISNPINEGYLVKDVMQYLASQTGCVSCYSSDFFDNGTNYVTGDTDNPLRNLTITEMSDIVNATGGTLSTILNLSLFGLYESLKKMFQLIYKVDGAGCFRVEHISKSTDNVIDVSEIGEVINNPCCYSVDRENIPRFESWKWNEANGYDFIGANIEYKDSNGNYYINNDADEEHDVSNVSTDINYLYNSFPNVSNLDGYIILANKFNGVNLEVYNEVGSLSGSIQANGHLSQANLHDNYWRDNRYLPIGNLNNNNTAFNSTKPYKDNDQISIKVCCESFTNGLNFDCTEIKTDCGQGIITDYELDLRKDILTITPKYR